MISIKQSYEQKLAEAQAKELEKVQLPNSKSKTCPHLANVNPDHHLTGSLKYLVELNSLKTKSIIRSAEKVDIQIFDLGISDRHAAILFENGDYFIEPYNNSRVLQNGVQRDDKFLLKNFDRLVFGPSHYFIFIEPTKFGEENSGIINEKLQSITVEKIQQEIAEVTGLITNTFDRKDIDELACINQLIDLMPYIEEANQMSIILEKMKYEPVILNPMVIGDPYSKIMPVIIAKKFGSSYEWIFESEKFIDKKHACQNFIWTLKLTERYNYNY